MDKIRSQEHGRELHEEFHREVSTTSSITDVLIIDLLIFMVKSACQHH
jgi:hypothetical protein